jgi:glycosyltransferase involved in cell wall biosynthesis
MKKISVLIAAFQAQRWLEECIKSINQQRLPEDWVLEVLLGVDGCASTLKKAMNINSQHLKIVSLKENNGPYVTFNTLMKFASGDLICRFDADDVMLPSFIAEQIYFLQEGADMTLTWGIATDEKLRPISDDNGQQLYQQAAGRHRKVAEGNFIIRRSVWDALGGFQAWRCGADTDFRDRVKTLGLKISVVEQYLYYRRRHENSLTAHPATNFNSKLRKQIIALSDDYLEDYRQLSRPLKIEPVCAEINEIYGIN